MWTSSDDAKAMGRTMCDGDSITHWIFMIGDSSLDIHDSVLVKLSHLWRAPLCSSFACFTRFFLFKTLRVLCCSDRFSHKKHQTSLLCSTVTHSSVSAVANMSEEFFREKHKFLFHNYWDFNKDGCLTWEDCNLQAEKFAVLQRHGKWEEDVVERWRQAWRRWWDQIKKLTNANEEEKVTLEKWISLFQGLKTKCKVFEDLPEFFKGYMNIFYICLDHNKDGVVCIKDYTLNLKNHELPQDKAEDWFNELLTNNRDKACKVVTQEVFYELVFDFVTSTDPASKSKYVFGKFDVNA
ncbi:unnamed protein product [Cyprideis torosa]|uniref:Uncharacterized protein n=1 Tax=Cyprideis torosa TaxID=163714 RepID=A0A7R8W8Q6_9CRUS|nr:unnamed protein product [Cyprideis torosa]CAG0884560.1 unnamed protein product [Cyprideis torosa]